VEVDATNRFFLSEFMKAVARGEIVAAVVTVRTDAKGLGWYPAVASQSEEILDLLRKKPDEITIEQRK
jgi:hypothetical protein